MRPERGAWRGADALMAAAVVPENGLTPQALGESREE